jgi:multidrug resistance efflux pump
MWRKALFQIPLKMSKIISKLAIMKSISCLISTLMISVFLSACNNKKEEPPRTQEEILAEVDVVQAIGKVIPAKDWTFVSSEGSGQILEIAVQEGDSVGVGQILFKIAPGTTALKIEEVEAKLSALQAQTRALSEDLAKAKVLEQELKSTYERTQRLLANQAETKEREQSDYSKWKQQQQIIASLNEQIAAQRASEKEQLSRVRMARQEAGEYLVKAINPGVLIELNAHVGERVNGSEVLAKIVDPSSIQIEAEVDELYANDVVKGQEVAVLTLGRRDTLAMGTVVYTSPILSNKSILYESANEAEDRRVRLIKIQVDSNASLAINSKVNLKIKLK